ncbi:hypothetical protein HK104_004218, partial [Borealophlyctis nickersoniae]
LPEVMSQLSTRNFFDYFSVKFLKSKHANKVCAIPYWLYWKVTKKTKHMEIPENFFQDCLNSSERFVFIPLCLLSPESPGGHANALLLDKRGQTTIPGLRGTIERFEPHGARSYEIFKDYHYDVMDVSLSAYFRNLFDLEYISPANYYPYLGPQSLEHYIDADGYCAVWSLWYIDMRLTYPDVPRETLIKGMFDKLHDKLSQGTLEEYLVNYSKQVYNVMVTEFPQYRDFFINYNTYRYLPEGSPMKKQFKMFSQEMENLVLDPLQINKPLVE